LIGNECKYKIYNVGSDQVISILNLAKKIKSLLSPNIKINIIGSSKGSKDNFNRNVYAPNISRARDEHSLDVWTDLDESINKIK
jgi:hypothetical protein